MNTNKNIEAFSEHNIKIPFRQQNKHIKSDDSNLITKESMWNKSVEAGNLLEIFEAHFDKCNLQTPKCKKGNNDQIISFQFSVKGIPAKILIALSEK